VLDAQDMDGKSSDEEEATVAVGLLWAMKIGFLYCCQTFLVKMCQQQPLGRLNSD
jgi:hypothetical protein